DFASAAEYRMRRTLRCRARADGHPRAREASDRRRVLLVDTSIVRRENRHVERLRRCDVVIPADLSYREHRLTHQIELLPATSRRGRTHLRPRCTNEKLTRPAAGQLLPQCLGNERHDGMQQAKRAVKHMK